MHVEAIKTCLKQTFFEKMGKFSCCSDPELLCVGSLFFLLTVANHFSSFVVNCMDGKTTVIDKDRIRQ